MRTKTKLITTIMITLFLASMLSMTVTPVMAEEPPKGPHYDVNFVTGGKIAFTSTLEGTTTPTVPPFYWHDNFEADTVGSPALKWTVVSGAWRVEYDGSNVYSVNRALSPNVEAITVAGSTSWTDYTLEYKVKITEDGVEREGSAFVRADSTAWNGYLIAPLVGGVDSGHVALWKRTSGSWTKLTTVYGGITPDNWHTIKVVLQGNNIKVYVDGATTPTIDYTDTTSPFLSGRIGLRLYDNRHAHFDDVTVLGKPMPGQSWIDDGPWYTETRTITGTVTPVSGGPIGGSITIESTSTLNAVTGEGTSSGTFTFTNTGGTGGFSGSLTATNTNFGLLDGTFVSTESTGVYADRIVEGTFNGYFYESTPGAGYNSFHATIVGTPATNEILVQYDGTVPGLAYVFGPDFRILDNDAGVFDGDCAVLQIPEGMIFDVYCSARGKPGGHMYWGCDHIREDVPAGKPTWHQHSPDNFDLRNFIIYFRSGEFGPQLGPYSVTSTECTMLATRWYPQLIVYPYDWIVLPLYNWYDGPKPYVPEAYHPMTPEWYVGIMAFKASPGKLRVDIALLQGKPTKTYQVLLWHDYAMSGQGYWVIGTLTTDGSGRGSKTISYSLTAGTYILGIDLMWDDGTSHQQILSAGSGVLGLQNSITIP